MKKPLLKAALFLMCGMSSMSLMANDYVFETFDAMPQAWSGVSGNADLADNTVKSALNSSNVVLTSTRNVGGDNWTGAISPKRSVASLPTITGYQYVHVMMYKNNSALPNLKVNDDANNGGGDITPVAGTVITPNEWQDVVFDISGATAGIDFIFVMIDRTEALAEPATMMIDNIIFSNDATPRTASIATAAKIDAYIYPSKGEDNEYSLENNWIYSVTENNYIGSTFGTANMMRGMAQKEGLIYLPVRDERALRVIDAITGEVIDTIALGAEFFTQTIKASDGVTDTVVTVGVLPFNDLKFDGNGNLLTCNGAGMPFQVWAINLQTGAGTLVLSEDLKVNYPDATIRFDAFGVYGDVNSSAIIMASNASAMEAYKWTITNGVAGEGDLIELDDPWIPSKNLTNPGSAPQIFPVDNNYFFVDGNATFPTLYGSNGNLVDGFYNKMSLLTDQRIAGTDTTNIVMNEGHNGLQEFQIGNEYFIVMAGRNTVASAGRNSFFTLYKYADASKTFEDMEMLWIFPDAGMGGSSNAYRTAMPSVDVEDYMAHITVYTGENGLAQYTMKNMKLANQEEEEVSVKNPTAEQAVQMFVKNQMVTLSENANVVVFNLMGQQVATAINANSIEIPAQGIFIIKATTEAGAVSVQKVVIK